MATTEAVKNGKPKTVAELQATLERLNEERAGYLATMTDAEAGIKECARQIFDGGDGDANERRKGFKMRRNTSRDAIERINMILPDLERELAEAEAREREQERERNVEEAKVFADGLVNVFSEVDRCLGEFRFAYTKCFAVIREARARNWVTPSEELMTSKMYRGLKSAFSVGELRAFDMAPLPSVERCSFQSIGAAYAAALKPLAAPQSRPPPQPQPAAKSNDRLPPKGDIGQRFRDDPKEFEIRIPTAR